MSNYKRPKALPEESKMRVRRINYVVARLKIKEDYCRRMQMNIEMILDGAG